MLSSLLSGANVLQIQQDNKHYTDNWFVVKHTGAEFPKIYARKNDDCDTI